MARIKYYYDTDTCKYERVHTSKMDVFINLVAFFFIALVLAGGFVYLTSLFIDSPKLAKLKKENEALQMAYEDVQESLEGIDQKVKVLSERDDEVYRVYFETNPIPPSIREGGIGGTDRFKEIKELKSAKADLVHEMYQKMDQLKRAMYVQSKSYDSITNMAQNKSKMLAAIPAIQPVSIKETRHLASIFGLRMHPLLNFERPHEGIDFSAPKGTPIYAAGDGRIEAAFYSISGGKMIVINHGYKYQTRYLHMSGFAVKRGERVKRGDIIGYVGSTGLSRGPHLHYEVLKDGEPVNPVNYFNKDITEEQFEMIVKLAAKQNE